MALAVGVALHTINVCIATKTGGAAAGGASELISRGAQATIMRPRRMIGVAPSFDRTGGCEAGDSDERADRRWSQGAKRAAEGFVPLL